MKKKEENFLAGKKIREIRKFLHLSVREFGDKIGHSDSYISRIENDLSYVDINTLKIICKKFDINEKYFLSDNETIENNINKDDNNYDSLTVGERLKKLRKERHYTQNMLAEKSETSQTLISLVEKNKKRLTLIQAEKIALVLNVGTDYLLYGKCNMKYYPVDDKLIAWLWEHEDVRKELWTEMQKEQN